MFVCFLLLTSTNLIILTVVDLDFLFHLQVQNIEAEVFFLCFNATVCK